MTAAEQNAMINKLVSAGVDKRTAEAVFGMGTRADNCPSACTTQNCEHTHQCTPVKLNPDALTVLKREINAKGIKMKDMDPAISKLLE